MLQDFFMTNCSRPELREVMLLVELTEVFVDNDIADILHAQLSSPYLKNSSLIIMQLYLIEYISQKGQWLKLRGSQTDEKVSFWNALLYHEAPFAYINTVVGSNTPLQPRPHPRSNSSHLISACAVHLSCKLPYFFHF